LKLASSALLKLTQDNVEVGNGNNAQNGANTQREQTNKDSVYIILDQVNLIKQLKI
jgi:hypothetical protein